MERTTGVVGNVRTVVDLHRILGDFVLRPGSVIAIFRADSWEGHRYIPCMGLSVGARDLLHRELCDRHQYDLQCTWASLCRLGRDGCWRSDLLVDSRP